MHNFADFDPIHDKALVASFGLLDSDEQKEIQRLAEQGEPEALAEMTIYREVLAQVAGCLKFCIIALVGLQSELVIGYLPTAKIRKPT